ncbi:unnamed protein product [Taenia asiatica]|uniref:Uncharacterized protein n=1 Tax=Taenia asiatica TaxID=60517 RepID=A0A3P6PG69_TAEAS|nr:unnamed protein product [Taenia asiatica]
MTLKQVIQYTFADNAQVGNAQPQPQQLDSFVSPTRPAKQSVQLFTFFAAVMDVGEVKSVVLNRSPQKFILSEPTSTSQTFSTDERRSYQRVLRKCEVTLIDESCEHFPMILWNEDLIIFALRLWKPRVTVLSIVDCPVRYDAFRRGVVAVPNDRTGIITMPSCEEAIRLAQYAKYSGWSPITDTLGQHFAQPLPLTFSRVPPEVSITESISFPIHWLEGWLIEHVSLAGIHTVRTIEDIINGKVNSGFGIVFAMLTKLSLDIDDVIRLVRLSCSNCQRRMQACGGENSGGEEASQVFPASALFTCLTLDCPLSGQRFEPSDSNHVLVEYNIFLNLTDHTGTYTRCTFTNSAMENIFGMQARDFLQLSLSDRGRLKWKLLLNRYKVEM